MPIIRTPFATPLNERDAGHTTTDVRFVNCYPEILPNPAVVYQKRYYVRRRAGVSLGAALPLTAPLRRYYTAFNDTFIADYIGVWSVGLNLYILKFNTPGAGSVGMIVSSVENQQLFICDGSDGWVYTVGVSQAVQINPNQWKNGAVYQVGQRVYPSTYTGYHYQCTVAGQTGTTEPTWPTTVGNTVTDGSITWKCIAYVAFPSANTQIGAWKASTAVVLGTQINTGTSLYAVCTTAGTTSSTTPTWGTQVANTVTDGSVTWTMISPNSIPVGHVPKPIVMNGFVFLLNSIGQIVNSATSDPMTWDALNYIAASQYTEKGIWIDRQVSSIAVYTPNTVEYLYVGNSNAQGSPLSRGSSATTLIGLKSVPSVAQKDGVIYFVANSNAGGVHIAKTDNMQTSPVSNEVINRLLENEGAGITSSIGSIVRIDGHYFYIINLQTQQRTFAYDINEHYWIEFTYNGGNWPFTVYSDDPQQDTIMFIPNSAQTFVMSTSNVTDLTYPIAVTIQTPLVDGGNMTRKQCTRITLIGDSPNTSSPVYIGMNYTDNDYQTWSTSTRQLQLNGYRPTATRLGSFRRRAFKFTYTDPAPFRLEAFELEVGGETENDSAN